MKNINRMIFQVAVGPQSNLYAHCIESVSNYCDKHDMEIEVAAKLLNSKIKQTIASEASDLNMMKEKIQKLPVR